MVSKTKRLIFVSALALSILGAGMYGAGKIQAEDPTFQSTLVEKIAQKFSLKPEDVQAVFDQQRQEQQSKMETRYEQRLSDAVSAGKITEAQKELLLAKHKELIANHLNLVEELRSLTPADRKAAIEKNKTDLETWAKDNGVDVKYLMGGLGLKTRYLNFGWR